MATFLCLSSILILAVNVQLFPSVLTRLGGTPAELGLLLSSLFLLYPVASVFSGFASDRLGKRAVLASGALLMTAALAVAAPLSSLWARIAAVLLFGAGNGILESQASAMLSDASPGRERSVLNLSQLVYCIGATGGPVLVAIGLSIVPSLGVGPMLAVAAGLSFLLFGGFMALKDGRASAVSAKPISPRALAADREWRLACVALFLYVAVEMGTAGWIVKYGRDYLSLSEAAAPLCLTVFWGGVGVSRMLVSFASGSLSNRRLLLGSIALTFASQLGAFLAPHPALALPLLGVMGFAMGSVWPTIVSLVGSRFKRSSGIAVGALVASGACAIPVIQPLIGLAAGPGSLGLRGTLLGMSVLTVVEFFVVARMGGPAPRSARSRRRSQD